MRLVLGSAALVVALLLSGCPVGEQPEGALGEEKRVYFQAPTDLVFQERLLVGATFLVALEARKGDDVPLVEAGTLTSDDPAVVEVTRVDGPDEDSDEDDWQVRAVGRGEAYLLLEDEAGEVIDRILVRAAEAKHVYLFDAGLVGSSVDARLPEAIGVVRGEPALLTFGAVDSCGGALVPLGALELVSSDPAFLELTTEDGLLYEAEGRMGGDVTLTAVSGEKALATLNVRVVPPEYVDRVRVEVAAADGNQAELWGRAFSQDLELIGLSYTWQATERVSLSRERGPNVIVEIAYPAEGQPADERPARVSAEAYGEEHELDLFTLTSDDLVTARVDLLEEEPPAAGAGCGGGEACDPYAPLALAALFFGPWRRFRHKRASDA